MRKIQLGVIVVIALVLITSQSNAQRAVLASGGYAVGSGGYVSYSIGQIDYTTATNLGASVSQGVQQPLILTTLPITLLTLKAVKEDNLVTISWETTGEININYFIIEHSGDGKTFNDLANVNASSSNIPVKKYSVLDLHPSPGVDYYRVKYVDNSGKLTYSKVVSVVFDRAVNIAVIYPNPTAKILTLKVPSTSNRPLSYKLYDSYGRLVISNRISSNETNISLSNLSSATYHLKIFENNLELKTFEIIKTN